MPSKEEIVELKAMVAVAKKAPVSIGVCLGKKATSAVVMMDRKRPPASLAREAKKAGETAKVAAGTLTIDGTDATFRCEDKPPGELAKQLKGFFAAIGVKLVVTVLLPDGKAAPQDADDPEVQASPEPSEAEAQEEEAAEVEAPDTGALAARLAALEPRIAAVTGGPEATLKALHAKAVELLAAGALDKAGLAAAKIEEALDKLPKPAAPQGGTAAAILDKLASGVAALGQSPGRRAMEALIEEERGLVASGSLDRLKLTAKRLQEGIALQTALDRLAPRLAGANLPDPKAVTALFAHLAGNVPAPDQAKAMAAVEKITQLLAASPAASPIQTLRQDWVQTRARMGEELAKLQKAIEAACREAGGLEEVIANLPRLLDPLKRIDARLEDKLAALQAATGPERDTLAAEARDIVKAYRAELASPFFREVDGANGFANVAVTSTAEATLARVETALAA